MTSYYKFKNLTNNFTYCLIGRDLADCYNKAIKIEPDKDKRMFIKTIITRNNEPYEYELQLLKDVDIVTNVYKEVKNV